MKPEVLGPIREQFARHALAMREHSRQPRTITPDNVYQEANEANRKLIHEILDTLVLPGSGILQQEHMIELSERSQNGASCLILMEHYSNFDIPALYYLLERAGLKHIADRIVAIAGMKLNEESEFVNAFAEAYTRLVIYPSRSLLRHTDEERLVRERTRSSHINMAATRQMIRLKHEGRIVLVFPSGTRYREGQPDTKRGVKEVDSYLKLFDYAVLVGIAGNVLRISPNGDMSEDLATRDLVLLNVSQPVNCRAFRETARANTPKDIDPKQYAADRVMEELAKVHEETERERTRRLTES
ncbi:MAG: 1-acyl-sn-glycerol-3-phosphate acyltransferase [Spirochaetota bacterium]